MLPLLLAASLLTGIGTSANLGETSPSLVVAGDVSVGRWRAEFTADSARKWFVPGSGYLIHGGIEWIPAGWLGIGIGQSYRHTSLWDKRITWFRMSATSGPLMLIAEIAPASVDREAKVEGRFRGCHKAVCVETRVWAVDSGQARPGDTYGYGAMALIGMRIK